MAAAGDGRKPSLSSGRTGTSARSGGMSGVTRSIWLLEHGQDVVTVVVGGLLIILSAVLLISGITDFTHRLAESVSAHAVTVAVTTLLDEVLLVLILVEVVHTVVLSLHSHRLVAQPFIIIGLVAVIRKILFVLSGQTEIGTTQLALLLGMVAVFVAGLIVVSRFEKSSEPDLD
jgi:uncharacterized membrane protein (DUF373 family)